MLMLVGMAVLVLVRIQCSVTMTMFVTAGMLVIVGMLVRMRVAMTFGFRFLFTELFPGQFFFAGCDHIQLRGTDPASVHTGNFQSGVHAQGCNSPGEDLRRNSGVQQ